ncbi:hypothetical protein N7510_006384 [Penicillium lagena]|uniref:uncharacterized protein n=1 Tax=Penicillium lagena TaxID=94218 RepID=UPI00253F6E51|nr:uncharacterized protein N7510_006384 [Penicillium lagena]KAJ5613190.1 hypothetical protein N7510_006384 [Penicillium lagena]
MSESGDRMFCHACGGVWLRDESGLTCPHCESDFTEIIEIPPEEISDDPPELEPIDRTSPRHFNPLDPLADHNPWARPESPDRREYGDNFFAGGGSPSYSRRLYRSPDGRFTFSSTTIGGGSSPHQGGEQPNPLVPMMVRSLDMIFQGLAETYNHQGQQGVSEESFQTDSPGWGESHSPRASASPGAEGLFPRNANGPQPMVPPVGSLAELLDAFRTDFGTTRRGGIAGPHVMTGPNPLAILSALFNADHNGDAVYSQEELDRVISQLIDQNVNGTAPPPASEQAIHNLPKKKVDQQMMGTDGKAECSICMEPVDLGTEVTVLPCTHWFHFPCIEAWLSQHNTCPHCRRGIDSAGGTGAGTSENPVVIPDSPEQVAPQRRRSSVLTVRSGRSSRSAEAREPASRRTSRSDNSQGGGGGGISGWVWSRFGGSS